MANYSERQSKRGRRWSKIIEYLTFENIRKWLGAVIIVVLIVVEVLITAQYVSAGSQSWPGWMYAMLAVSCVALDVSVALKFYVIKTLRIKLITYGIDFLLLLTISVITGNDYIVALYCLVTTELYIANEKLKINAIIFGVSAVDFVVSFVCGWVRVNKGTILYTSIVQILGGVLFGLVILILHFSLLMLVMSFYRTYKKLQVALKEAEESKAALKDAYKKLSQTAVYEERNRIAKEIHDSVGHSMTGVIMLTEAAKLMIDSDPSAAKQKVIAANIQAKSALDQMRGSVHLLAGRDGVRTLKDEIEEVVAQSIDAADIKIRCDLEDISADSERARFLCNSLKECISNGLRHGGASAFYVELKRLDGEISLLVSDNGSGLGADFKEGYGLASMRQGAEQLGGVMRISGEEGEGCEVTIFIPES